MTSLKLIFLIISIIYYANCVRYQYKDWNQKCANVLTWILWLHLQFNWNWWYWSEESFFFFLWIIQDKISFLRVNLWHLDKCEEIRTTFKCSIFWDFWQSLYQKLNFFHTLHFKNIKFYSFRLIINWVSLP